MRLLKPIKGLNRKRKTYLKRRPIYKLAGCAYSGFSDASYAEIGTRNLEMDMEQSGDNIEMRKKKKVGQKLVTEKSKTKNPLRCNGFFVYMINSDYSHSLLKNKS